MSPTLPTGPMSKQRAMKNPTLNTKLKAIVLAINVPILGKNFNWQAKRGSAAPNVVTPPAATVGTIFLDANVNLSIVAFRPSL
mmetsp:Transcript_8431/g.16344  ORF Transcript_8431/g.16344 Transcript_8431/m.16344 type:complete len:83 (-) Transcript_8431:2717-2965(-)